MFTGDAKHPSKNTGDRWGGGQQRELTGKHGVEVGAARCQHYFVRLDFLVGHMEHDVTQQAPLSHPVHGHKGVVVVALGVVRDAVAVSVQQLHSPFHHGV